MGLEPGASSYGNYIHSKGHTCPPGFISQLLTLCCDFLRYVLEKVCGKLYWVFSIMACPCVFSLQEIIKTLKCSIVNLSDVLRHDCSYCAQFDGNQRTLTTTLERKLCISIVS